MKDKRGNGRMPLKYTAEFTKEKLIVSEKTDNYKIHFSEGL